MLTPTMKRLTLLAALAAVSLAAAPNFSGDWKMVPAKSEFGAFPAPSAMSQKVTHAEPSLKVSTRMATDNGDFDFDSAYTTDGKESTNQFGPNDMKSTVKWDADTLVIDTKGSFGDTELTIKDKWTLSEDGKTLTITRHFSSARGEVDQKVVLEKQ
jgi:hypothetical protein